MFSNEDLKQITGRGSRLEEVMRQIENFRTGFPFLKVVEAASPGKGILQISEDQSGKYETLYHGKISAGLTLMKFVPASGAASRMFKSLFAALDNMKEGKSEDEILAVNREAADFFKHIRSFAFYPLLESVIIAEGKSLNFRNLLEYLLTAKGCNYGSMPKGLLLFHTCGNARRTAFEEHLVEGAHYAKDIHKKVRLHFTVSQEHERAFRKLFERVKAGYEEKYGVSYEVDFSRQKPSTDTIAVDMDNKPFREKNGTLLFRPGGHGALIENLNDLDADLVFVKNIDNVVPDSLKEPTSHYKKLLAGVLLHFQERIFKYQKELNEKYPPSLGSGFLAEASSYLENELNTKPPVSHYYTEKEDLVLYLREKYNRPIRVCGMVKNLGEPGGGPFWAENQDGTVSLQIGETAQIDLSDPQQSAIAHHATHFNPVDVVCGLKNYRGEKFDLLKYTDPLTCFISKKSSEGRDLKAMELPGLWNGAMSDWNTLFVEVPVITFNPVKTVNDLLREQHQ